MNALYIYVGETKKCLYSRWLEHKPGVGRKNRSAVKDHAENRSRG